MKLSSYQTDLQILCETKAEEEKFKEFCKQKGQKYERFYSNVFGQNWYGKYFYEIPFRSDLANELTNFVKGDL